MFRLVSLLLIVLLFSTGSVTGHSTDTLSQLEDKVLPAREIAIQSYQQWTQDPNQMSLQLYEQRLGEALAVMDDVILDKCYHGLYTITRMEFELQIEGIRLARSGNVEAAQSFFIVGTGLDRLRRDYYQEAVECEDAETSV